MPRLLSLRPPTDARRRENDRHRPVVVAVVLAVLAAYLYLFTQVSSSLGLPLPQDLVESFGITIPHVFDDDRNVDSNVGVLMTQRFDRNDDERLVLLLIIVAAFLCAYFLPLQFKQPALTFWTVVAIWLLYGGGALAGLLAAHLSAFLVLHPRGEGRPALGGLAGALWVFAFAGNPVYAAVAAGIGWVFCRYGLVGLVGRPGLGAMLRVCVVHAALIVIALSIFFDATTGAHWKLPLGVLLFFWQWARMTMYYIDYQDGLVPERLSVSQYLAVFFNPAVVPSWSWGVTIGQGFAYLNSNYLAEDKNRIVVGGVKLLCAALAYLIFWNWGFHWLVDGFESMGISVNNGYTARMVQQFSRGQEIGTASVLATTMLDLIRFMMFFAGVVHFKVGLWRIFGYNVAPYYNRPWQATNLMSFWTRYAYHYREFLVRAFYYPVFFRFARLGRSARIVLASLAAAGAGNLIWHITERAFFRKMDADNLLYVVGTWPYFLFLGLGIAVAQLILMRRGRRRKPWSRDWRLSLDVVAVYITLQYFALIHIFARPAKGSSAWDLFRLFARGFGLEISG